MPTQSVEAATRDEAIAAAREQYGSSARVVGVRRIRSGGMFGFFTNERFIAEVEVPKAAAAPRVPADDARPAAAPAPSLDDRMAELADLLGSVSPKAPDVALYDRAGSAAADPARRPVTARALAADRVAADRVAAPARVTAGRTATPEWVEEWIDEPAPARSAVRSPGRAATAPAAGRRTEAKPFAPAKATLMLSAEELQAQRPVAEPAVEESVRPSPFAAALTRMVASSPVQAAAEEAAETAAAAAAAEEAAAAETAAAEAAAADAARTAAARIEAAAAEVTRQRVQAAAAESARVEAARTEAARTRAAAEAAAAAAVAAEAAQVQAEAEEAARIEAARIEAARVEAARIEAERAEAARIEAARVEAARIEAARMEAARIEAEQAEAERLEAARIEAVRAEAARVEAERLEAARVEAARVEAERAEAARLRAEAEAAAEAAAEAVRRQAEAAEEAARRQAVAEAAEAARRQAEEAEAARAEAARLEAARIEAARLQAEAEAEVARLEAARVEAARVEAVRVEAARLQAEAEAAEAVRVEAARLEAARLEAARVEAARVEAVRAEAARLQAEAEAAEIARVEAARLELAAGVQAELPALSMVESVRNADEELADLLEEVLAANGSGRGRHRFPDVSADDRVRDVPQPWAYESTEPSAYDTGSHRVDALRGTAYASDARIAQRAAQAAAAQSMVVDAVLVDESPIQEVRHMEHRPTEAQAQHVAVPVTLARTASDPAPLPMDATRMMPALSLTPPRALGSSSSGAGSRPGLPPVRRGRPPVPASRPTAMRPQVSPAVSSPTLPSIGAPSFGAAPFGALTSAGETGDRLATVHHLVPAPSSALAPFAMTGSEELELRLLTLGVPDVMLGPDFSADAATRGVYAALTRTLTEHLPAAPYVVAEPGDVIMVVGPGAETFAAARSLALSLRLEPEDVQWAASGALAGLAPAPSRITSLETALERRRTATTDTVTIVAVDAPLRTSGGPWMEHMLSVWDPATVWAVMDSTRKPEDLVPWLDALPRVDAVIVSDTDATADPAAVLGHVDVPVALVDGTRATAHRWASLLCERLEEMDA
ncbi:hypothetical protein KUM42_14425 [Modestobacter sp. L9-4]|uniref:hypothetical protein n=1 Tax=Modestobacter sp. L9-4 TaxID=2851567 RepID=UPI001C777A83|nr:hypothetical protein [Modestobacter sp. L9-4]QXG75031.1 hypothetical protein KUM42_14425 [Modestobacter sp. L9-4]